MKKTEIDNTTPKEAFESNVARFLHLAIVDMFEAGDPARAMELLEHLLRWRPDDPDVLPTIAVALSDIGLHTQALPLIHRAVAEQPGKAKPLASLGAVLARNNNLPEAEATLEKALAIDADCPFCLTCLASCLVSMGKSAERAEDLARKACRLMPSHQGAWWNLGRALALQGRLAEADEALLQAIRIDPSNLMSMLIATLRLNLADWNPSASPDLGSQN